MNNYRETKTINKNTKKAQRYINAYEQAGAKYLWDVYATWSDDKAAAYQDCSSLAVDYNAAGTLRIIKACTNFFTAAFKADDGLHVLTSMYHYIIK